MGVRCTHTYGFRSTATQGPDRARKNGYAVAKLPNVVNGRAVTDVTDDTMGAKIVCALIRHLFEVQEFYPPGVRGLLLGIRR